MRETAPGEFVHSTRIRVPIRRLPIRWEAPDHNRSGVQDPPADIEPGDCTVKRNLVPLPGIPTRPDDSPSCVDRCRGECSIALQLNRSPVVLLPPPPRYPDICCNPEEINILTYNYACIHSCVYTTICVYYSACALGPILSPAHQPPAVSGRVRWGGSGTRRRWRRCRPAGAGSDGSCASPMPGW